MILARASTAGDLYVRALANAYRSGWRVYDPDYALSQDPEAYEKIRRDAVIAHAIEQRRHLVAGRDWTLEPASERPEDQLAAEVVEELLDGVERFAASRFLLADAVIRGAAYAYVEGAYVRRAVAGGPVLAWWCPRRLRDVDKRRLRQVPVDPAFRGGAVATRWEMFSVARQDWEPLAHPEWFVRHVYEDAEPTLGYGRGLMEAIYYYWWAKTRVLEEGLAGVERWAQGLVHVGIDGLRAGSTSKTNADLVEDWLAVIEKWKGRHAAVHDKNDEVEILVGGMEGWQIVRELLGYLDAAIRCLVLGSNLPTSATEGGSYALAQVQENSTEALLQYDRRLLEETLTRDLVGAVWRLNRPALVAAGLGTARPPRLKIAQEQREDPKDAAEVAGAALDRGVPLRADEFYRKIGFTPPKPGEAIVQARPRVVAPPPGSEGEGGSVP